MQFCFDSEFCEDLDFQEKNDSFKSLAYINTEEFLKKADERFFEVVES